MLETVDFQPSTDPSDQAIAGGPAPAEDLYGQGPKMEIDPTVIKFVEDPDSLSAEQRQKAAVEAERLSRNDAAGNRVIATTSSGEHYWAAEHPSIFTFNGSLRANFEEWPEDPEDRTMGQHMLGEGGHVSDVIIETDDGHAYLFQKTNDEKSAVAQEFQVTSTTLNQGKGAGAILSRKIESAALKDVVVLPGRPLTLGKDPQTGKWLKSGGNVTRVTAISRTEDKRVDSSHPFLSKPEKLRNTAQRFNEALRTAREMDVAAELGPLAVE